jgi:hypothetical protein
MNSPLQSALGEQQMPAGNNGTPLGVKTEEGRNGAVNPAGTNGVPANATRLPLQTFEELEIPDVLRSAVEQELTSGEKILWLGRPSPSLRIQIPKQVFLYASIGLALFGLGIMAIGGFHIAPVLFGGAFVAFGAVMLVPWLKDPMKTINSCYVLTNRRTIVAETPTVFMQPKVTSYLPHQLVGLEHSNHPKVAGAGDLIFEYTFALPGKTFDVNSGFTNRTAGAGRSDVAQRIPNGFLSIDNVREVERLIRVTLLGELESALDCQPEAAPDPSTINCLQDGLVAADVKTKALTGLDPSEKVVWIGQPVGKLLVIRSLGYAGVGAMLAAVALFWLVLSLAPPKPVVAAGQKAPAAAAHPANPLANGLMPAGLLLLSIGLAAVPFIRGYNGGRSLYAITNRRALVYKHGLFGPTRESYPPLEVSKMQRSDAWLQKGCGDLIFRTVHVVSTSRTSTGLKQSVKTTQYGFLAIRNVRDVEKILRETLIDRFVDKLQQASSL